MTRQDKVLYTVVREMTRDEAFGAMLGLYVDYQGCGSGIRDEVLRAEVVEFLRKEGELPENKHRLFPRFLDRRVAEEFLSEGARSAGSGCEDVQEFLSWVRDYMI